MAKYFQDIPKAQGEIKMRQRKMTDIKTYPVKSIFAKEDKMPVTKEDITKSILDLLKKKSQFRVRHQQLMEQSHELRQKLYNYAVEITEIDDKVEDYLLKLG